MKYAWILVLAMLLVTACTTQEQTSDAQGDTATGGQDGTMGDTQGAPGGDTTGAAIEDPFDVGEDIEDFDLEFDESEYDI